MKLPEAIALMLEGKVMVDNEGHFNRIVCGDEYAKLLFIGRGEKLWYENGLICIDGWRIATEAELKELGL